MDAFEIFYGWYLIQRKVFTCLQPVIIVLEMPRYIYIIFNFLKYLVFFQARSEFKMFVHILDMFLFEFLPSFVSTFKVLADFLAEPPVLLYLVYQSNQDSTQNIFLHSTMLICLSSQTTTRVDNHDILLNVKKVTTRSLLIHSWN